MGDLNTILHIEERRNGAPVQDVEIRDFNSFLEDTGMMEMKTVGRDYTFTNHYVYSRIDRAMVNASWTQNWAHLETNILDSGFSDHSPLCVTLSSDVGRKGKSFRFLNCLASHKEFMQIVEFGWSQDTYGSNMNRI